MGESEVKNQQQVEGSEATSVSLAGESDDSLLSNSSQTNKGEIVNKIEDTLALIKIKLLCRIRGLDVDISNGHNYFKSSKQELEELYRHLEKLDYIKADIKCAWKYLSKEERKQYLKLTGEVEDV